MRNAGIKIDATRAKYDTGKAAIEHAGLIPVKNDEKAPFVWIDGILKPDDALDYDPGQILGKIPGMDYICYKSTLFKCLNHIRNFFPQQYEVFPRTFVLPDEFPEFQREHMHICGRTGVAPTWVLKPKNGCCGNGIQIIQSVHEVQDNKVQGVIQQYVNPYLIDGKKFDFRFYVFIASLSPLTVFLYNEGIARFCSEPFQMPNKSNKDTKFMHLTNTAINVENGAVDASVFTKKATDILQIIENQHHNRDIIWERISECARAVIIGILPKVLASLPKKKMGTNSLLKPFLTNRISHLHNLQEEVAEAQCEEEVPEPVEPEIPEENLPSVLSNSYDIQLKSERNYKKHMFQTSVKADIIKHQTNMILMPGFGNKNTDCPPLIVGSIVTYRINPTSQYGPLIVQRRYDFTTNRLKSINAKSPKSYYFTKGGKVVQKTQNLKAKIFLPPAKQRYPSPTKDIESKPEPIPEIKREEKIYEPEKIEVKQNTFEERFSEEEEEKQAPKEAEKKSPLKPLPLKKRFNHVLGIDIMLDANMNPQVLELNDRPSLSVTVDFEKDLKESLLCETFEHISPNGEVLGNSEKSGWQQIFPLPKSHPNYTVWAPIYEKAKKPNNKGEIEGIPVNIRPRTTEQKYYNFEKTKEKKRSKKKAK
ncbi:Tubulin-tyrosine ligase family protein [Trichomonas vaginalis G3]|uniref:Tubulin-tyrosine ligase family protein n=1 Tax=Trichomonas vaginalis (strain ATCC PRA-98 / G3) TaxID=412133 RepID=A2ETF9_TRIV3|nr:tubulin polyglutamylase TTLl11 family [Trichomonas vaginalis G3]EAY04079.1 Tubulin-tyrosine ligase family protein [Trichomonas vaginalis G3]KAI5513397.1 tubulin polyglutamylase TTLl11 family [Trichomonas vaginalis G3]|eukprot:XP_001316302.1 Tubulin-tyrosine ligase family protein [Trichomonas vaginalis G3]